MFQGYKKPLPPPHPSLKKKPLPKQQPKATKSTVVKATATTATTTKTAPAAPSARPKRKTPAKTSAEKVNSDFLKISNFFKFNENAMDADLFPQVKKSATDKKKAFKPVGVGQAQRRDSAYGAPAAPAAPSYAAPAAPQIIIKPVRNNLFPSIEKNN